MCICRMYARGSSTADVSGRAGGLDLAPTLLAAPTTSLPLQSARGDHPVFLSDAGPNSLSNRQLRLVWQNCQKLHVVDATVTSRLLGRGGWGALRPWRLTALTAALSEAAWLTVLFVPKKELQPCKSGNAPRPETERGLAPPVFWD
jgi:hypothetical protein